MHLIKFYFLNRVIEEINKIFIKSLPNLLTYKIGGES